MMELVELVEEAGYHQSAEGEIEGCAAKDLIGRGSLRLVPGRSAVHEHRSDSSSEVPDLLHSSQRHSHTDVNI